MFSSCARLGPDGLDTGPQEAALSATPGQGRAWSLMPYLILFFVRLPTDRHRSRRTELIPFADRLLPKLTDTPISDCGPSDTEADRI